MIEKYIILSILYLEYFVQKFLCGIYYTWQSFGYWNFNRNLDKRNLELYNKTPKPHHD
jgi:hypothetical protein